MELMDIKAHDGSRQFLAIPQALDWDRMRDHIAGLPGATVSDFLTDHVTEVWIDFSYRAHTFTVNNQFGEYWFFVSPADCPEEILRTVAHHCGLDMGRRGKA
ncbi:hypothetical protein LCGC14_1545120 [marine sediment metagenome]|uniref:Uncharacterized protein n=1 Tax=marine sediment metagenome TaxID=412755 RepID=A0A0F9IRY0_9ZZZZ